MTVELLKAILFGIVEGVTEWLPISSTGHLILLNEFVRLDVSPEFQRMFDVVIQLGAILAVVVLFHRRLNPFDSEKTPQEKREAWKLWQKVCAAVIPSGLVGVVLGDWMEARLFRGPVVAAALISYGAVFLLVRRDGSRDVSWKTAFQMGLAQCLSLIPGTSRSGSTILGGILAGASRSAAAEFSFLMAVPTMLGASAVKLLQFFGSGAAFGSRELWILLAGCLVSFVVSLLVIQGLMDYVRQHSFAVFGWYRIVLGCLVLAYYVPHSSR